MNLVPLILALVLAPLMKGIINRTKAFFSGKTGPSLLQAHYDVWKLLHKGSVYSHTTTCAGRTGVAAESGGRRKSAGRHGLEKSDSPRNAQVRIEIVIPENVCEDTLSFLRTDFLPKQRMTACVETVDVVRPDHFVFVESPSESPAANHGPQQHAGGN